MLEQYQKWIENDWENFRMWVASKVIPLGDRIEITKNADGEVYVKFRLTLRGPFL